MKRRWKILGVLVLAIAFAFVFLALRDNSVERELEQVRQELSRNGFKVDLGEFDFSITAEDKKRAGAVLAAGRRQEFTDYRYGQVVSENPHPIQSIGTNTALVIWEEETLDSHAVPDAWTILREVFRQHQAKLDEAANAVLSGRIAFGLQASRGLGLLLPHLADLKTLSRMFAARALLEMRDGNLDQAWTNLLAATRIATAYETESIEISHLVKFTYAAIAYDAAWQLLQAHGWSDEQLLSLQKEWEKAEFLKGLPGTVAFTRAATAHQLQLERQDPAPSGGFPWQTLIRYPQHIFDQVKTHWARMRFLSYGTYEAEQMILKHYAEQETRWRAAALASSWVHIRQLPGIKNTHPDTASSPSLALTLLRLKQMTVNFQQAGRSTLGRAAEAETRRRLVITAVALERFRLEHGSYPAELHALVPDFLPATPHDFMDGKPLRYRRAETNRFLLYSVGLDCIDDGGRMAQFGRGGNRPPHPDEPPPEPKVDPDLVWPLAATEEEVLQDREARRDAQFQTKEVLDSGQAEWQWTRTARRHAKVDEILAREKPALTSEPTIDGRPISEVLRNASYLGSTNLGISDLLTLRQVVTEEEPERITFELPIHYATLTNLGDLSLYVDPLVEEDSDDGCSAVIYEVLPATNGNSLLVWEAGFDAPGRHALQAGVLLRTRNDYISAEGPLLSFVSSNVCQFNAASLEFDPRFGPTIRGKLVESNAVYSVDFICRIDNHRRTLTGKTTNGVFTVYWDLMDEQGKRCTSDIIETVFHFTFPESGRSFSQKGP